MSARRFTIPVGKKAIITASGKGEVVVYIDSPPRVFARLKAGESTSVGNLSEQPVPRVQIANGEGDYEIEIVDIDDC